ncbi:hypothetical protein BBJ28_00008197 [Nothophytophthora sp. Chile5]|nr:hypothetical protein BBJ28_00008197 [Nothophytophthora sp. Chile5]
MRATQVKETTALTIRRWKMAKERTEHREQGVWSSDNEQDYKQEMKEFEQRNSALLKKKLLLRRTRKYRLFPTRSQQKTLRKFMGTCRWTYNQAVAHFRATNESNALSLTTLYVTKTSKMTRTYPDGMGSPPEWAFETPSSMRSNIMRALQTNVKSAFSNLKSGNIKQFNIQFSSKKKSPNFTFSENGRSAKIEQKQSAFCLSVSKLKDIRVKMDRPVDITSESDIMYSNGFWYVAIPELVEPDPYEYRGTCIALDPGTKAFMTGVDLEGNVLEFGRDNKTRLNAIRKRQDAAQSLMAKFKNQKTKSKRWQYRSYVRAKRTFMSCTAKLKNCVKELHYKTCAYLTKNYDAILLPIFKTKEMVKKSSTRNHGFNKSMLSLNHYQFRQLLLAKCEVKGKAVVVCSEMYTSQTCGRCYRLHAKLGSSDVFTCPHCSYSVGRDVNAALNILCYVCAGSLQVYH